MARSIYAKTVAELFTELSKEVRPRQAVTYVKDLLAVPSDPEDTQLIPPTVREHDLSTDEALRLEDPHFYRFKKIVERSRRTSMDIEHEKCAADAHMDAAEKIDHAKELAGQALTEIEDISRGMSEKIVDERNRSYNESAGRKMPSEGEMQKADECARDADSKEARRQSEQQYDWSLPVF